MRQVLMIATLVLVAMSASFTYAAFYCANSGESDIAQGLSTTFAIPFALAAFISLAGYAATPREDHGRRKAVRRYR